MSKINIRHLSLEEIQDQFAGLGEPRFRAGQIWQWIWQKGAPGFHEMTNLPKDFREKLEANYDVYRMSVADRQLSKDKTIKCGFRLYDGCLLYTSPSPRDRQKSRMPSSA